MCGLAGIVNSKTNVTKDIFKYLEHRGPDYKGEVRTKMFHVWHTTLAIQSDVIKTKQPINNKKNTLVFNGELFNKEVQDYTSDTNYLFDLLHLNENPVKSISDLIGPFAFAYIDKKNKKIFLSRDMFGSRPLFYYWKNEILVFGSTLDVMLSLIPCKLKKNHDAIESFIERGHFNNDNTFYEDIKIVTPGSLMIFDLTKKNKKLVKLRKNYSSYFKGNLKSSFEASLKRNLQQKNTLSNPYLAISGGIDSGLISSASENLSLNLNRITGFHPGEAKEKTKLTTNYIDVSFDIGKELHKSPEIPYTGNPSMFYVKKLAEFVKQNKSKVMLTGTGADEFFGGYRRNLILKYPLIIRIINSIIKGKKLKGDIYDYFSKFLRISTNYNSIIRHYKFTNRNEKKIWTYYESLDYEKNIYLPNELSAVLDQGCMIESIEPRSPFLDQAFCAEIESMHWNKTFFLTSKINLRILFLKYKNNFIKLILPKKGMTSDLKIKKIYINYLMSNESKINNKIFSKALNSFKFLPKKNLPTFLIYRLMVVDLACKRLDENN